MAFSRKSKEAIKGLAVAYEAFNAASSYAVHGEARDLDICIWGERLLFRQTELGVEIATPETVELLIKFARSRRDDRKAVAA